MPRRILRRLLPHPHFIRDHQSLRMLSGLLHDENLWHLNRRSVSTAAFVGVFVAFVPVPLQMLIAAAAAVLLRCNLTLSVALVWITNPITMPPIYYLAYRIGARLMGERIDTGRFEFTWSWMLDHLQPFLLGCFLSGLVLGLLAFVATRILWNLVVLSRWRDRRRRRQA